MNIPVTIAMFASTKGHYGKVDLYKQAVNAIKNSVPLNYFNQRVVHIKREQNDELVFSEMNDYFTKNNFKVLTSFGQWKHYDESHFNEHARDIYTLMSSDLVQSSEYVLWIEDDVVIQSENFLKAIGIATKFLKDYPKCMNFAIRDIADQGKLPNEVEFDSNIRTFGDSANFSFRCSIFRARDVFALASFYKNSFKFGQSPHIEAFAAQVLSFLSNRMDCLAFFNRDFCSHKHIGTNG